jgi:hypothetical protein
VSLCATSGQALSAPPSPRTGCVLLFSGGRDSTIAALRLSRTERDLTLATVTTDHLTGIARVVRRLIELRPHMDPKTEWFHFSYAQTTETGEELVSTCLSCHAIYAAAGLRVAEESALARIAFGYTAYQSAWAEQTSAGRRALASALGNLGISVVFPVADLSSKEATMAELRENGLTDSALEQKCLKQQFNRESDRDLLEREIARWKGTLLTAVAERSAALVLVRRVTIRDLQEQPRCLTIL